MGSGASSGYSKEEVQSYRLLRKALSGDTSSITMKYVQALVPKNKLMVFVSSTFTDTHRERNILSEVILPVLQKKARPLGIAVIFVDMRYGVKDENTRDHMTWIACANQIRYCAEHSAGIFFLSLQSNKYGYRPLPKYIKQDCLTKHQKRMKDSIPANGDDDEALKDSPKLLNDWYYLNQMLVPPQYALKHLPNQSDHHRFHAMLPILRRYLSGLEFEPHMVIGNSVTEYETKLAFSLDSQRCYWLYRHFQDIEKIKDPLYTDISQEPSITKSYEAMIEYMKTSNVPYTMTTSPDACPLTIASYLEKDDAYETYITAFKEHTLRLFEKELEHVIQKIQQWHSDHYYLGLYGEDLLECIHHLQVACANASDFVDRKYLVDEAIQLLQLQELHQSIHQEHVTAVNHHHHHRRSSHVHRRGSRSNDLIATVVSHGNTNTNTNTNTETAPLEHGQHRRNSSRSTDLFAPYGSSTDNTTITLPSSDHAHVSPMSHSLPILHAMDHHGGGDPQHRHTIHHPQLSASSEQPSSSSSAAAAAAAAVNTDHHHLPATSMSALLNTLPPSHFADLAHAHSHEKQIPSKIASLTVKLSEIAQQDHGHYSLAEIRKQRKESRKTSNLHTTTTDGNLQQQRGEGLKLPQYFVEHHAKQQKEEEKGGDEKVSALHEETNEEEVNDEAYDSEEDSEDDEAAAAKDEDEVMNHNILRVSMCVVGVSGSGKTALMSKLSQVLYEQCPTIPIITRFCGTSSHSMNAYQLLYSICLQIQFAIHGRIQQPVPTKYSEVVTYFHTLLTTHPIILLLDGLDQLSDQHQARSRLNFLRCAHSFHAFTRIIVSTLPDEKHPVHTNEWLYCYQCDTRLREANTPRMLVPTFDITKMKEAEAILLKLLTKHHMHLPKHLTDQVLAQFKEEPTILYIQLAMNVIETWMTHTSHHHPSSSSQSFVLQPTVKGIIHQIFNDLENNYGSKLVRYALAFITFSISGVSDDEIQDLLSLHDGVVEEVFQYSQPDSVRQIPMHVWLRLRHAMKDLLVQQNSHCWSWYHRQLHETAQERYTDKEELQLIHRLLGTYFGNIVPLTLRQERLIDAQPLTMNNNVSVWYHDAIINVRRCTESVKQFMAANMWKEATEEMCHFEYICACTLSGYGFTTVENLFLLIDKLKKLSHHADEVVKTQCMDEFSSRSSQRWSIRTTNSRDVDILSTEEKEAQLLKALLNKADHYLRWIQKDISTILTNHNNNTTMDELNRPNHIRQRLCATATLQPHCSLVRQDYCRLLHNTESMSIHAFTHTSWYRMKTMGGTLQFSGLVASLHGHKAAVTGVQYNQDGSKVISSSFDHTMRIWDAISGNCLQIFEGHSDKVNSVSFNADSSKLISGSDDKTAKIWDVITGNCVMTLEGHIGKVVSVSYSPVDAKVVSGSWDRKVIVWDAHTGETYFRWKAHTQDVTSVAFNHDGTYIASGSDDRTIKLWNVHTGHCEHTLSVHARRITSVAFSRDGSKLISGSDDKTAQIWNAITGDRLIWVDEHVSEVTAVTFNEDGKICVTGSRDGEIMVWNATVGSLLKVFDNHTDAITGLSFSSDNAKLMSSSADRTLKIWDLSTTSADQETTVNRITTIPHQGHTDIVTSVAFSPDGERVLSASMDKTVRLWDTEDGNCLKLFKGHKGPITSLSCHPDGLFMATGCTDGHIRIWQIARKLCVQSLLHGHPIESVCYSNDGLRILSAARNSTMIIWDTTSEGRLLQSMTAPGKVNSATFNIEGSKIVYCCQNDVYVVNVISISNHNNILHILHGHEQETTSASFNHDSKRISSASLDSTVRIWDTVTGNCLHILRGHHERVNCLAYNIDGSRIASGSDDTMIRIWDGITGKCLETLEGHTGKVLSLSFASIGSKVVSGGADKKVIIWDAVTKESEAKTPRPRKKHTFVMKIDE